MNCLDAVGPWAGVFVLAALLICIFTVLVSEKLRGMGMKRAGRSTRKSWWCGIRHGHSPRVGFRERARLDVYGCYKLFLWRCLRCSYTPIINEFSGAD